MTSKKINFLELRESYNLLMIHLLFSAVSGSFIYVSILKKNLGPKNVFITDFSSEKLAYLLIVLLLVLFFYAVTLYFFMRPDRAKSVSAIFFEDMSRRISSLRFGGIGFLLCWVGYFISSHLVFEDMRVYFSLIKPLLLWGCLFFVSMIFVIHLAPDERRSSSVLFSLRSLSRVSLFTLFLLLLILLLIIRTGIGVSFREDYWYGAGVPVLWMQIGFSLIFGIAFSWMITNVEFAKKIFKNDTFIFFLVWLIAAYFWASEPLRSSHFLPNTGVNEIFPYSDGATFDIGSQYALIGQGLFNGQYFDRSLYSALLTYFHIFAGQNTAHLMIYQAIVFAVFPSILYLIGKELYGRIFGLAFSVLILFRGINGIIGSSMIDSAGPKMMLTDFPTAIGVSIIILLVLKWMKEPQRMYYMVWAGCSIGLTLLLRTHVILLLPIIVLFVVSFFNRKKVFWVYGVTFLILGMLVSTMPLDIQNQKKGVPIFYMYYSRIQLILKERYGFSDDSSSMSPEKPKVSLSIERERFMKYRTFDKPACDTKYCAVVNHFLHNLTTSILSLPASFSWDDFRHTVKGSVPYWQQGWVGGGLSGENYILLLVNLSFISVGVGASWERLKYRALFPLVIYFFYMMSNSLAFTSGGRYITPVDWVVYVYYFIGVLKSFLWALRQTGFNFLIDNETMDSNESMAHSQVISHRNLIGTFLIVFMVGSIVPLADTIAPQRYHDKTNSDVLAKLSGQGVLKEANLTQADISEFLNSADARVTSGRLLYPRFYASGEGEYGLDYPYTALDYRRLVFLVIGSLKPSVDGVIFPVEHSIPDLHASDVVVIGCANNHFLDAAIIYVLSDPPRVYLRSEDLVLQCPLPNP